MKTKKKIDISIIGRHGLYLIYIYCKNHISELNFKSTLASVGKSGKIKKIAPFPH